MKLELFNAEINNIWKKAAGRSPAEQLQFEFELYKKLLSFFHVGDYCFYIFNVALLNLEFVSKEVELLFGYDPSAFTLETLLDKIHPDDHPYFLNFEHKASGFLAMLPLEKLMKYKVRYDFRFRRNDGVYLRVLQQSVAIEHDEDGKIIRTLSTHTDITHLKPEGTPVLSFIGLEGEPSYINVDVQKVFVVSKESLSRREKEVLRLLIEGKLSKEIGDILNISKQTVDRHRKNLIGKNNLKNTAELVSNAIKKGWI